MGGKAIGSPSALQMAFDGMVIDGTGGAYVVWREMPTNQWMERMVKVAANGLAPGWDDTGIVIATGVFNLYVQVNGLEPDGQNGLFVLWSTTFGGVTSRSYGRNLTRLAPDGTTDVQLSLVKASATTRAVTLWWHAEGGSISSAILERKATGSGWSELSTLLPDGSGDFHYVDSDVIGGSIYAYRLRYDEQGRITYTSETLVDVPRALLILRGAWPNPTGPDVAIAFGLDGSSTAVSLEILDLQGRRQWNREVGALGPGEHVVAVQSALGPGIYYVRLTGVSGSLVRPFVVLH
jgi:hypothetical protein